MFRSQKGKTGSIGRSLTELMAIIQDVHDASHKAMGYPWLGLSHSNLLIALHKMGDMSVTEVAKNIGETGPTASVLIRCLKKEGMLVTSIDPQDRRRTILHITEKGRTYCRRVQSHLDEVGTCFTKDVTEEELGTVLDALEIFKQNMSEYIESKGY